MRYVALLGVCPQRSSSWRSGGQLESSVMRAWRCALFRSSTSATDAMVYGDTGSGIGQIPMSSGVDSGEGLYQLRFISRHGFCLALEIARAGSVNLLRSIYVNCKIPLRQSKRFLTEDVRII